MTKATNKQEKKKDKDEVQIAKHDSGSRRVLAILHLGQIVLLVLMSLALYRSRGPNVQKKREK